MDLGAAGFKVTQEKVCSQTYVNAGSIRARNFLISWVNVSFDERPLTASQF
jgi:hypothetical protein